MAKQVTLFECECCPKPFRSISEREVVNHEGQISEKKERMEAIRWAQRVIVTENKIPWPVKISLIGVIIALISIILDIWALIQEPSGTKTGFPWFFFTGLLIAFAGLICILIYAKRRERKINKMADNRLAGKI